LECKLVFIPRHFERSMQISRTPLSSCHKKICGTEHCQRNYRTTGFLRSLGVTPVHRYCSPSATYSPSSLFPVQPVIGRTCPRVFLSGTRKSLQLLNMPSSPCCPYHSECHVALVRPRHAMRPSLRKGIGLRIEVCLEATCGFTFVTGDSLSILRMALSASS